LEKNPETPLVAEIEKIRDWLFEAYHGKLSEIQRIRLDEIIGERLKNIIDAEQFQKILNFPKNQFGIGLSFRSSLKIGERMEAILVGNHNNNGSLHV